MSGVELFCTKSVRVTDPPDAQGRGRHHHGKCNLPAAEYEIGGLLTKVKAVLCVKHKLAADQEAFISNNGYSMGKVKKSAEEKNYQQERLPGTGTL